MIAKVCAFLAVVAVAHAGGLVGVGAGHLGLVSSQSTAINHVAPVGAFGVAGPLGLGHGLGVGAYGLGVGAYGLGAGALGHGIGAAPLAVGHGIVGGNLRASGLVGNGVLGSNYGSVIGHTAAIGLGGIHGGALGHGGLVGLGHGGVLGRGGVVGLGHGGVLGLGNGGVLGLGHGIGLGKAIL